MAVAYACLLGTETEELLHLTSDQTAQATRQYISELQDLLSTNEEPDRRHLEFYVVSWMR